MNVRTICLAVLYEGEASGYEIRKQVVEGDYSYFVEASFGSIYPALAKLEDDSLVTARIEAQDGKPSKKIYAITASGRREFLDRLSEPLAEDQFRSEFLMFARFVTELPRELVAQRLAERRAVIERELTDMQQMLHKHSAAQDCWVIGFGRACLEAARHYIDAHGAELVNMARDGDRAEAAE
jgi:DNA-binding PadR family transcriptional regulator